MKDIEESVSAGSAETSEEQAQTKEASTGTVEAESGSGEAANAESMPEYVTVVRIIINPELELYLDGDGKVVATSVEDGYLTEGKTITVDFVEQKEETDLQNMMETVQTAVQDELSEKQLSATLELGTKGEIQESVALHPEPLEDTQEAAASEPSEKPASAGTPEPAQPANNPCPDCGGTGICPECGGGTLPCKRCGGSLWESCGVCGGAGGKSCSICNGKGVVSDDCILCHGGKSCTSCGGTGIKK